MSVKLRDARPDDAETCGRICYEAFRTLNADHDFPPDIPTVEMSIGILSSLIGTAPIFHGPGFLVPTRNAALLRWCLEQGLRNVQPMTLMSMGRYQEPRGAWLAAIPY